MALTINLELEEELEDCLKNLAKNKNIELNQVIAKIIDDYFENLLDDELLAIAQKSSVDIKSGKEKTIPFSEIKAKYGL